MLGSISIPDQVTFLGNAAFEGCISLSTVKLSNNLKTIDSNVFYGCQSLTNINLPSSVTRIGYSAFRNCTSLTSIVIPEKITTIETSTFEGCTSLKSVTLPTYLTVIDGAAFSDCSSLTSINIPDRVKTIGGSAFKKSPLTGTIVIPAGTTSIGGSAFSGCHDVTIYLPEVICNFQSSPFNGSRMFFCVYNNTSGHKYVIEQSLCYRVIETDEVVHYGKTVEQTENGVTIQYCDKCGKTLGSTSTPTPAPTPTSTPSPTDEPVSSSAYLTASASSMGNDGTFTVTLGIQNNPGIAYLRIDSDAASKGISIQNVQTAGVAQNWSLTAVNSIILFANDDTAQNGNILTITMESSSKEETTLFFSATECYNSSEQSVSVTGTSVQVKKGGIPGDVNGDGVVDGRDLLRLARYLAGANIQIDPSAADTTGDGNVDGRDVLRLAKQLAGM